MKLRNTTEDQMTSFYFFESKPFLLIASALVLYLVFYASFFGFGFSSILFTSLVLILSTLLFTFTKQKPVTDQEILIKQPVESEAVVKPQDHEEQELEADDEQQIHDYSNTKSSSQYFLSESESLNHLSSSEESEVEWPFREIVYQSPDCSDGSISDEESDLIEISLLSGHYVGNYKDQEVPKFHFLKQHGLMELLATEINDMNEEDNLIEIDISMGSIKCSRFEIEA